MGLTPISWQRGSSGARGLEAAPSHDQFGDEFGAERSEQHHKADGDEDTDEQQHVQSLIYTGRTLQADDALRFGFVDEVAAPDALAARAEEMARQLAAVPQRNFVQTKRQLRDKAISRAKHYSNQFDDDVRDIWSDPETHAHIREYLAKTVRK